MAGSQTRNLALYSKTAWPVMVESSATTGHASETRRKHCIFLRACQVNNLKRVNQAVKAQKTHIARRTQNAITVGQVTPFGNVCKVPESAIPLCLLQVHSAQVSKQFTVTASCSIPHIDF